MDDPTQTEKGCYTDHGVSGYGVAIRMSRSHQAMDDRLIKEVAEKMMLAVAEKCIELGARAIGHIKSHIMTEAGTVKADTIGISHGSFSAGQIDRPVTDLFMAVNSIIQGIPEHAVKAATLEGIHQVAENFGISVVKEKEHTYFDEFDFTASKKDFLKKLEEQFAAEDPRET